MVWIDFILNVAGLLLWLNWRSISDPFARNVPATLSGTLRRAQPVKIKRWHYLFALLALLLFRGMVYEEIGPAVNWTAKIDLYFVVLSFHEAQFSSAQLFSLLSFGRDFVIFHFWLLMLSSINRSQNSTDPIQKMIVLQLSRSARWPAWVQVSVSILAGASMWLIFQPALVYTGVVNRAHSGWHLAGQSLLVGGAVLFSLKYLLPAFLAAHVIASYVYLGRSPLWDFVSLTARNILAPLKRLSLCAGRVDLAPVLGIALIVLLLHVLPGLALLYLDRWNLTLWPQ